MKATNNQPFKIVGTDASAVAGNNSSGPGSLRMTFRRASLSEVADRVENAKPNKPQFKSCVVRLKRVNVRDGVS